MIEARDVVVEFGVAGDRLRAVDGVTIAARGGEILALLGPNGAGKSTLLRVLALLLAPSRGEVYFDGVACAGLPERALCGLRRQVGLAVEAPFAYNFLTGREYLQLVGEIFGLSSDHARHAVAQALARWRLEEQADVLVRTYSQGMLKKLALAAACLHGPRLLLLDEPTNSLDPSSIVTLREVMEEARAGQVAVVVSTHSLEIAQQLADRVAIMARGRVVCEQRLEHRAATTAASELEHLYQEATKP